MRSYFLVLFILFSSHANACGSVAQQFAGYWNCDSLECKNKFIKRQQCSVSFNYLPLEADKIIVSVLADAIDSGVAKAEIVKTFDRYNCAFTAKNLDEHTKIEAFIGKKSYEKYCSQARMDNLYLINASSGASLRSQPSKYSKRIDVIAKGRVAKAAEGASGQWLHVRTDAGDGYIYKKLLTSYQHADRILWTPTAAFRNIVRRLEIKKMLAALCREDGNGVSECPVVTCKRDEPVKNCTFAFPTDHTDQKNN